VSELMQLFAAPNRQQFSRPASRSYHLWAEGIFLLVAAGVAVFLSAFFRLRLDGQAIFIMSLPVAVLAILGLGIVRIHQFAHEAYKENVESQINKSEDNARAGMLLDKLAYLSFAGFTYAVTAVILAYGAVVPSIAVTH
jgi:hypothetical protein